jgi:hypothetical protein
MEQNEKIICFVGCGQPLHVFKGIVYCEWAGTFLIDEFISSYGRDSQLVLLPVVGNPMVKRLFNLIATLEDYLDIPIYIRVIIIQLHTYTTLS